MFEKIFFCLFSGKASLSGIMVTRSKSSNSGPKDLVATAANTLLEPGFDQAYVDYLSRENVDGWEIRKAFNDLAGMDLVPEPEIIIAGLKACRKVNDYALTTRILEVVRWKAKSNKAIWPYIVQVSDILFTIEKFTPESTDYQVENSN